MTYFIMYGTFLSIDTAKYLVTDVKYIEYLDAKHVWNFVIVIIVFDISAPGGY